MASKLFDWREDRARLSACGEIVHLRTRERVQVVDVSELVSERVRRSGVGHGVVSVQVLQTAAAVFVAEDTHAGAFGSRASFRETSLTLNVTGGRLVLGEGFRVLLVDRDGPRTCRVSVVVLGASRNESSMPEDSCPSR
jgi:thiamine phosphate synthase YjbQ (UPF0047 family)